MRIRSPVAAEVVRIPAMKKSHSQTPTVKHVQIDAGADGQRLDNFLLATLKGVPKSHIYRLIRSGQVRVNKGRAKQTQRLVLGDTVRIPPVRVAQRAVATLPAQGLPPLEFLYQDEHFWVLNKPSGLAVHGGSGHSLGLIESLRVMYPEEKQLELVHRLDRDTSGAIIVARRRASLKLMQRLLQEGGVGRYYWLVGKGFSKQQAKIEAPLWRQDEHGKRKMVVSKAGRPATTLFRLLAEHNAMQLIEAQLLTGRTHQIRVHAQFGGFPIIGDERYGDAAQHAQLAQQTGQAVPLLLHARRLVFRHPYSGAQITLNAPLGSAYRSVLRKLNLNDKLQE